MTETLLPAGPDEPAPLDSTEPTSRSKSKMLSTAALAVAAIAVGLASFVPLPYYRIAPGSVYDTVDRVEAPLDRVIEPQEGDIGFVTVSQTADITGFQWLTAQISNDVLIVHEDEINGDRTTEEKREEDRRRMQVSKNAAVVVALDRLGHELTVTPLGVEVAAVFDCSAADNVLGTGDVIVGIDGAEVLETDALLEVLQQRSIGDEIQVTVDRIDPNNPTRSIATETVAITLGSADDDCLADEIEAEEPRPFIGIGTSQMVDEQLPFDVDIETGRVGGPSAGLAFTLAIIDVLSEGELTNGLNVVATGTIDRSGGVGPVGGIHQKTVAAEDAGADLFLVPLCCDNFVDDTPSNYEEAVAHADDMVVVGVNTLDEALAAIGDLGGDVERFMTTS